MKKLSRAAYGEIKNWMYRNARPLDLALWRFRPEGGPGTGVVTPPGGEPGFRAV